MKKCALTKTFYGVILSSLMLLPVTSYAIDLFDTNTGFLVIPEVDVNGDTFYDDVTLKLDFSTGKFEVVSATPKPETIFPSPIESQEDQDIKMDFMGCARSRRNEIICHVKLTSLGGFDRPTRVYASYSGFGSDNHSHLYDNLGNIYKASEVTIASLQTDTFVTPLLIAGIPTLAKFKFTNISPEAINIALFSPLFYTQEQNILFTGDFRNINF